MRRARPFERDFRDLHGADARHFEAEPVMRYRLVTHPDMSLTQRIALGLLGLFGVIVLGVALIAMLVLVAIFGWAALTT